ncbi:MAG: lactate racemase domain-containing protein [Thermodesulfobacteriota bacterium]
MRVSFPYTDIDPLEIPEENLIGVFSTSAITIEKSEEEIIKRALANHIGSPPLSQRLKGEEKILILVDDYTRTTPTQKILNALGPHRPMTEEVLNRSWN